ncbi:DUF2332 domain-containing protein [Halorientalis pallida]|uniref:DUF2332 domain-containing protein n=1 Tax=Halorientalis pallida TaxID=2479928 RepID=A0A498KX01_9EURY|nr:DUF2332 domain-containing protein [Halorientalis pallida]RXK46262.1 DUF2332 domain-containing protein [Halorientalis pallida]
MTRADEFHDYTDWATDQSPLYERLSRATADDDALLDLAATAPPSQPAPNLLLGAVHHLLLSGVDHRLAEFYPTVTENPTDPTETDPVPAFESFCLDHREAIRERLETRLVQTNDVGRSAVLYPACSRVAAADGGPLALVELGASAGLNLLWARYRYEFDDHVVGDPDSPVRIETTIRDGTPPLPDEPPTVAERWGVDLNPLDVTDESDARWLRALVLPNQHRRHERLAAALELAADRPPELVAGDAADVLPERLGNAPTDATLVVFSTIALYQFPDEAVAAVRAALVGASHERPVHWLSGDPSTPPSDPTYRHGRFEDGTAETTGIAEFEAYGNWLSWLV